MSTFVSQVLVRVQFCSEFEFSSFWTFTCLQILQNTQETHNGELLSPNTSAWRCSNFVWQQFYFLPPHTARWPTFFSLLSIKPDRRPYFPLGWITGFFSVSSIVPPPVIFHGKPRQHTPTCWRKRHVLMQLEATTRTVALQWLDQKSEVCV